MELLPPEAAGNCQFGISQCWAKAHTPVNQTIMESTTIRRINRRIRKILAQHRWILIQIHHKLRQKPSRRRKLAHKQLVQARHIHRRLMNSLGNLENKLISRRLSEQFESARLVEDEEVCIVDQAEGSVVGHAG
jgi:hypothetical protein